MNSGRRQAASPPQLQMPPPPPAEAATVVVVAPAASAAVSEATLQNWCQQGLSPEGLREFRVSMEGMTVPLVQQLARKLNQSELFAKLGVYGAAPNKNDHDEIIRILFSCIEQSKSIFCLSLSSPMGDAKRFAQYTLASLTSLILSSETMTLEMAEQELKPSLIHNTSLQEFTIEFGHDQNSKRIFDTLISGLAQRSTPLHKLCVVHEESLEATTTTDEDEEEDLESEHREGILGSVREMIQLQKCPTELEWIGCDVVAKDLQVLASYLQTPGCRLEALAINDCVNKLCHVSCLAQVLSQNTSLTRLHLDCDQLDDADMQDLADGLVHNTTLHTLHVCGNRITDEGIVSFCHLWRESSAIQQMDMGFNLFGPQGARALLRAVAAHPRMQSLSLIQNDNLNYQGLQWIGEELAHVSLKTLSVSCVVNEDLIVQEEEETQYANNINNNAGDAAANPDQGANHPPAAAAARANSTLSPADAENRKAQQQARKLAGEALLRGIQANVTLRDLDISYNEFAPQLEQEIRFYVELNKRGRCFLSNFFELSPALIAPLLHKCGDEPKYMYYLIREQPLLVDRIMNHAYDSNDDDNNNNEDAAITKTIPPPKRQRTDGTTD